MTIATAAEGLESQLHPIKKLTKDLKKGAATLSPADARHAVTYYYQVQDYRKSAFNQERMLVQTGQQHEFITYLAEQFETLEHEIRKGLDVYSSANPVGRWAKSIVGIGPVLAAGLLAYVDVRDSQTVGQLWSFAGLNPNRPWLGAERARSLVSSVMGEARTVTDDHLARLSEAVGRTPASLRRIASVKETVRAEGQPPEVTDTGKITRTSLVAALSKRPWNRQLKVLCAFKIGESFVYQQKNEKDVYGKLFRARKDEETARNERGEYREQAAQALRDKNYGKDTDAYAAYSVGMLPKAHVHARARRWAVKLFLSHYHHVAFFAHHGVHPPRPYVHDILGHHDIVQVPNAELIEGFAETYGEYLRGLHAHDGARFAENYPGLLAAIKAGGVKGYPRTA